jgi:hypothetical protein
MIVACEDDASFRKLVCLQKPFAPDAFVAHVRGMLEYP